MTTKRHKIAVIPGDGIGQEVIPAALSVLEPVASRHGFSLDLKEFPYGCAYYTKHGHMMAEDAYDQLAEFPAIEIPPARMVTDPGLVLARVIVCETDAFPPTTSLKTSCGAPASCTCGETPEARNAPYTASDHQLRQRPISRSASSGDSPGW